MNIFSKVVGYKINIKHSIALPYTNNEHATEVIRKTIPYTQHAHTQTHTHTHEISKNNLNQGGERTPQ